MALSTGLTTHKLRALLKHADANNTWYEVYSTNIDHTNIRKQIS